MIDFSQHKKGDVVRVHCCDRCARRQGVTPKVPADSGVRSWPCEVCGHYGIGSTMRCRIGDWLVLEVLPPLPGREHVASTAREGGENG